MYIKNYDIPLLKKYKVNIIDKIILSTTTLYYYINNLN